MNVVTTIPFSKRYLKYLTKKYLKQSLQDSSELFKVIATSEHGLEIKWYNKNIAKEMEG